MSDETGKNGWDVLSEIWQGIIFLLLITLCTPLGWIGMAILFSYLKGSN